MFNGQRLARDLPLSLVLLRVPLTFLLLPASCFLLPDSLALDRFCPTRLNSEARGEGEERPLARLRGSSGNRGLLLPSSPPGSSSRPDWAENAHARSFA